MATPKITGMIRRKARRDAKGGVPAVGDLRQRRVERFAQTRDDLRQRIGEVAVLAAAEAVTCHDDAAAEQRAILVAADKGLAIPRDRKSTTLKSSHYSATRLPAPALKK